MNETAADLRTATIEQEFSYPPEKLWRALTEPLLIADWLMKNDFRPVIGHNFKLSGDWGGVLDCKVLEIEPHSHLSYTWDFAHDDDAFNLKSIVTFTLKPTSTGTMLRVEQSGFRPAQKQAYGGAHAGWKQFFTKLETVLGDLA